MSHPVTGNPGEWSIAGLNDATPWIENSGFSQDAAFIITGTFVGTISLQVSNQRDEVKTRLIALSTTYTAPSTAPLAIPSGDSVSVAKFYRFIFTAYTSGTAYVGLSKQNTAGGDPVPVSASGQLQTNVPIGDYFINPLGDVGP